MQFIFAILGAAAAGILAALEPTINGKLGTMTSPFLATMHSSLVGTVLILIISLITGSIKDYHSVFKAPPYLLIGGLVGMGLVYLGGKVSPILGIAATLSIMVATQLITGVVIDSLGIFGVKQVHMNMGRLTGILLLLAGVQFIIRS